MFYGHLDNLSDSEDSYTESAVCKYNTLHIYIDCLSTVEVDLTLLAVSVYVSGHIGSSA